MKKLLFGLVALALLSLPGYAQQNSVRQFGTITPGHVAMWGSPGVIGDGGTAVSGFLTSLGVTNNGGPGICLNSAPTSGPYNQLCLAATTNGGAKISSYAIGGATTPGITFDINGTTQGFPAVSGLPTAAGGPACFLDVVGTLTGCSLTAHGVAIGQGSNAFTVAAPGTAGIPLVSQGASSDPAFGTALVNGGGTGLTSGTSGGVPYFNSATTMASSGALTASRIVLGGGAGAAPTVLGSLGTTTTLLHGNAAGAPSFGAVALGTDVSGQLPTASGGTNLTTFGAANRVLNSTSSSVLAATEQPTLGTNGGTGGQVTLNGSTSGNVTVKTAAAAGTNINFQLPTTNGSAGNILSSDGSGNTSWISATGVTVDVQVFTTTGANTWTRPGGVTVVYAKVCGAGAGGGGGARQASATASGGGGGGGGGYCATAHFKAADAGASQTVTVGTGGTGGGGATVNGTAGGSGIAGGSTTFGALLQGSGGGAGAGGSATTAVAGSGGGGAGPWVAGGVGGTNTATGGNSTFWNTAASSATNTLAAPGPCAGGSATATAPLATSGCPFGGAGGGASANGTTAVTGGAGGDATEHGPGGGGGGNTSNGNTGAVGGAGGRSHGCPTATTGGASGGVVGGSTAATFNYMPGCGGGGGGGGNGGAGGTGGAGTNSGGGGGGGAGNAANAGTGGAGGNGFAIIISW